MLRTFPSSRFLLTLGMMLLIPGTGLQLAEAQELGTGGLLARVVVDEGRFLGGELQGLARALRVELSVDRASASSVRGMRQVEVVLYAIQSRSGEIAGTFRSRPFVVTPTGPGAEGGPSDRFVNVDYGEFFIQLQKVSPYPAGIRFETLQPIPAETVERDPAAAFAGRRLPPLLIVAMPADPRLRGEAMAEPLALWESRR